MKIALVVDADTGTCFRIAGCTDVIAVKGAEEAERRVDELLKRDDLGIILVAERLIDQIQGLADKIADRKFPLIVPIPDRRGPAVTKTDLIVDLIRRKAGIEVKL